MSEACTDFARAAERWRNARSLRGFKSLDPKPWSIQKVHTSSGKILQRLAEYDLFLRAPSVWTEGQAKEEAEEMARERGVSFATVKKDIKASGKMVQGIFKYLGSPNKLWAIVVLLLVYIPKQKLEDVLSKTLPELLPQPEIYYHRIYQSRAVFEILKTVYYTSPAPEKTIHRQRRSIKAPEGWSVHQLILPRLNQSQQDEQSGGKNNDVASITCHE